MSGRRTLPGGNGDPFGVKVRFTRSQFGNSKAEDMDHQASSRPVRRAKLKSKDDEIEDKTGQKRRFSPTTSKQLKGTRTLYKKQTVTDKQGQPKDQSAFKKSKSTRLQVREQTVTDKQCETTGLTSPKRSKSTRSQVRQQTVTDKQCETTGLTSPKRSKSTRSQAREQTVTDKQCETTGLTSPTRSRSTRPQAREQTVTDKQCETTGLTSPKRSKSTRSQARKQTVTDKQCETTGLTSPKGSKSTRSQVRQQTVTDKQCETTGLTSLKRSKSTRSQAREQTVTDKQCETTGLTSPKRSKLKRSKVKEQTVTDKQCETTGLTSPKRSKSTRSQAREQTVTDKQCETTGLTSPKRSKSTRSQAREQTVTDKQCETTDLTSPKRSKSTRSQAREQTVTDKQCETTGLTSPKRSKSTRSQAREQTVTDKQCETTGLTSPKRSRSTRSQAREQTVTDKQCETTGLTLPKRSKSTRSQAREQTVTDKQCETTGLTSPKRSKSTRSQAREQTVTDKQCETTGLTSPKRSRSTRSQAREQTLTDKQDETTPFTPLKHNAGSKTGPEQHQTKARFEDHDDDSDDDDDDDDNLGFGEAPVVSVRKTTQQSFTGAITGLEQRVQEMIQSRDPLDSQIVPTSGGGQHQHSLASTSGSASSEGPITTLNVQLNLTQQQFGDVTVKNANQLNQSFGGSQNISRTATIREEQTGKDLSKTDKIMERTLSRLQTWNEGMVRTDALEQVLEKMKNGTTWLTIKGNPGEGKTTVGFMTLEEMHRSGRQVYEVRSPEEFTEVLSTSTSPVIMLDDVFGDLEFNPAEWSLWKSALSPLLKEREHRSHEEEDKTSMKDVTVILIGRDYVLNSASVDLGRLSDFLTSSKHVVCMDHSLMRGLEEKRAIWDSISRSSGVELDQGTVADILRIEVAHGFPHVCRLFTTIHKENKAISAVEFFKKPLNFLNTSVANLFKDTDKVMLFTEMVKGNGRIGRKELRELDPTFKVTKAANSLLGTYIKVVENCFVFDHPSIYDSVAFHLCSWNPEFVIQKCPVIFIHERLRLYMSEDARLKSSPQSGLVVNLNKSYAVNLAERFATEIMKQNFVHVLSHQAFTQETFVSMVMSKITIPLITLFQLEDKFFKSFGFSTGMTFLYFVPSSKSPELLKYIDSCPEIVLTEDDEKTLLLGTCKSAASDVLSYLKDTRKAFDINVQLRHGIYKRRSNPLIIAAQTRDVEFVHQVLSLKPDLNARDDRKRTAFHFLCQSGLASAVSEVIDRGADIDVHGNDGESPLSYAGLYRHLEIVKLLIKRGARIDEKSLIAACRGGDLQIVDLLLEKDKTLHTAGILTNSLSGASEEGHIDIMKLLVDKGASITSTISQIPALHAACGYKRHQAVKWLLLKGADINSIDVRGNTPLHKAVLSGSKECVDVLLKAGATVNIQNKEGNTPLHNAARSWFESEECVDVLLKAGATVNIQNKGGNTPLHNAALMGSKECVDVLLKAGATVNILNKEGDTPLHNAASRGSKESVDVLLKAGANVNILNKEGNTPLHTAEWRRSKACQKTEVFPLVHLTINWMIHSHSDSYISCCQTLIQEGANVNCQNIKGDTPLHILGYSTLPCDVSLARLLIDSGADVNICNNQGTPALHGEVKQLLQEDAA